MIIEEVDENNFPIKQFLGGEGFKSTANPVGSGFTGTVVNPGSSLPPKTPLHDNKKFKMRFKKQNEVISKNYYYNTLKKNQGGNEKIPLLED